VLAGVFGIAGGIVAGRLLSRPITKLADAAHAIGAGDLSRRVPVEQTSLEVEELTQAFNRMAAELERAAELRTALMADVSHELRTPLTVLEGNLRAALDHVYALDDEQIANLYAQTRHLIRLVNDLHELALAEADQLPMDKRPLDLGALVQETVSMFELLAGETGVRLHAEVEAGLPRILADPVRIRQVLHNLLGNALRHTHAGGAITVAAKAEDGGVSLTVQDDGDGIDAQHIGHVFDRFYRTDPSRSRETGGSGLGLAITRAVVEAHGGRLGVASAGVGQGSTFTVWLRGDGE
jgi:signal transduction histidine kinase